MANTWQEHGTNMSLSYPYDALAMLLLRLANVTDSEIANRMQVDCKGNKLYDPDLHHRAMKALGADSDAEDKKKKDKKKKGEKNKGEDKEGDKAKSEDEDDEEEEEESDQSGDEDSGVDSSDE